MEGIEGWSVRLYLLLGQMGEKIIVSQYIMVIRILAG